MENRSGYSWNVQGAVLLKNIFFLAQAGQDQVNNIGTGEAVTMLLESVKQVLPFQQVLGVEKRRSLHLEQFENICALANEIPVHILSLRLNGTFWKAVEQVLLSGSSF